MKAIPLIDVLQNLNPSVSRKELYARIMCGEVFIDGECVRDSRRPVNPACQIRFETQRYVSRGGKKLEAALKTWSLPVYGKIFIDAGASTGGFTDCLLKHGARLVHAVDVGHNQIDYRLRVDERVVLHERTNIMKFSIPEPKPHAAVADLSFRSIHRAAEHILSMTIEGWMVALVKPQFEQASRIEDDFSGVVHSAFTLRKILEQVYQGLSAEGIQVGGIIPSPITGRRGNQEFLFLLCRENSVVRSEVRLTMDEQISEAMEELS